MPSHNTYRLTWVSLSLEVGYLFTATPPDLEHGVATFGPPVLASRCSLDVGLLLSATVPDLSRM